MKESFKKIGIMLISMVALTLTVCCGSVSAEQVEIKAKSDSLELGEFQKQKTINLSERAFSGSVEDFTFSSEFFNESSGDLNDSAVGDTIKRVVTMQNSSTSVMGVMLDLKIESMVANPQIEIPTAKELEESFLSEKGSEELENLNPYTALRYFSLEAGDTITLTQKYELISPTGIQVNEWSVSSLTNAYRVYVYTFDDNGLEYDQTGFQNVDKNDYDENAASYNVNSAPPKLEIEKTVRNLTSESDFYVDDILEYQIKVTNSVKRSILDSGEVIDELSEYLASPTNIKLVDSSGNTETFTTENVYDEASHKLKVPLSKRLVGGEFITVTFETALLEGAAGNDVANTAFVEGTGLLGGYTSGYFEINTALNSEIIGSEWIDGTEETEIPMISDGLIIPATTESTEETTTESTSSDTITTAPPTTTESTSSDTITTAPSTTTEPTSSDTITTAPSTTTEPTSSDTITTAPPTTTAPPSSDSTTATPTMPTTSEEEEQKLPSTGESSQSVLILFGFFLVLLGLGYKNKVKK